MQLLLNEEETGPKKGKMLCRQESGPFVPVYKISMLPVNHDEWKVQEIPYTENDFKSSYYYISPNTLSYAYILGIRHFVEINLNLNEKFNIETTHPKD